MDFKYIDINPTDNEELSILLHKILLKNKLKTLIICVQLKPDGKLHVFLENSIDTSLFDTAKLVAGAEAVLKEAKSNTNDAIEKSMRDFMHREG